MVYNLLLILLLATDVRWWIYRGLRDNGDGLLWASVFLCLFPVALRIVLLVRWGERLWTVKSVVLLVGRVLVQLAFIPLIAVGVIEFPCVTNLSYEHEFKPFGKTIVFHRHDCFPDGNESVYIRHKYSPFLTDVGFYATPISDGYHNEFYHVEDNLLYIKMVNKTVVYDLKSGTVIRSRQ